jgi:hypothetical protein
MPPQQVAAPEQKEHDPHSAEERVRLSTLHRTACAVCAVRPVVGVDVKSPWDTGLAAWVMLCVPGTVTVLLGWPRGWERYGETDLLEGESGRADAVGRAGLQGNTGRGQQRKSGGEPVSSDPDVGEEA